MDGTMRTSSKQNGRILLSLLALSLAIGSNAVTSDNARVYAKGSKSAGSASSAAKEDSAACRSCVSQAASLFATNQLEKAANLLRESSAKCPNNSQLHLMLSTIIIRLGEKGDEALREAALACAAAPDSQAAHLQYAMTLQAASKYSQAAQEFEAVANLNPGSYEAWSALADIYKRLRQDDDAKNATEKAAALEPGTQAIRLQVLQNLKRSGKHTAAKKELKRLIAESVNVPEFDQSLSIEALQLGAYDEALETAARVLKAYPNSAGALKIQAISYLLKHNYSEADASAGKLLADKQKGGEAYAIRGISRLKMGKPADAEKDIDAAVAQEPASGLVMLADGLRKLWQGDFENASEQLRLASESGTKGSAIDKIPQSLAHIALSQLYRKQGLLMESVQEAHSAAADRRFECDSIALESRALAEDSSRPDNLSNAGKLAQAAMTADPSNPDALLAQSAFDLKTGHADTAKKSAEKASQLNPYCSDAFLTLARISQSQGNSADCEQMLEKGLVVEPKDPELLSEKARLLLAQSKAPEAASLLKVAMAQVVRKPDLTFMLAEACEKSGNKEESLKYYKQSLSQGLSGDYSTQAKTAISRLEAKN